MIKLYLKTLTIVILSIFLVLLIYQFGFSYLTKENFNSINRLVSKGTFFYIQTMLEKTPQSNWASALAKLQPSDAPLAKILPIKSLPLNKNDKSQLLDGNIVFSSGKKFHFIYFLYYGRFEGFALQRIAKSQFALQLMLTEPINQTIRDTMHWMVHIILRELNSTSKEKWPLILEKLQITFGMPLKLIPKNSAIITDEMREDLNTYAITYSKPGTEKPISTLYFNTSDPQQLLVIGPIQYAPLSSLFSVAQLYYFISFALASILIVAFLTWLFSRNILKIYQITKRYSKGDFSQRTKVSPFSILHGAYENVVSMGNNLKLLMQSQHNMTRFVAHEIRTPLSTMQLALDTLNKRDDLSDLSKQDLASIQEDIQDLNKLMNYFLLYSQSALHELKLKNESLCLHEWLEKLIKRYQSSPININYACDLKNEKMNVNFDPNLLKHAIDNLLTNALKFANKEVMVNLEVSNHNVKIHVDDDGPGISPEDRKNVLKPFVTLDSNQTFGKHIGLGLTIANAIIELHGGSITITDSPLLGGSRFTVQFPVKS